MRRKKKLMAVLAVIIIAAVGFYLYKASFHFDVITDPGDRDICAARFFFDTGATVKYKYACIDFDGGRLKKVKADLDTDQRGFFPLDSLKTLPGTPSAVVTPEYGQLMFYENTAAGELFAFDKWQQGGLEWRILRREGDELTEYSAGKTGERDCIMDLYLSGSAIYVHHFSDDTGDFVVTEIMLDGGEAAEYTVPLDELGLTANDMISRSVVFDPRNKSLVFLYTQNSKTSVGSYDTASGDFLTFEHNRAPQRILLRDGGYYLVDFSIMGTVRLYGYDMSWGGEKLTEISLSSSIGKIKELGRVMTFGMGPSVYMQDGIIYGCATGAERTWFYAVDPVKAEPVGVYEIKAPKNMHLVDFEIYTSDGVQPFRMEY